MAKLNTDKLECDNPAALIKQNSAGRPGEQTPIYLQVDWEEETITTEVYDFQTWGSPEKIWHNLISVFRLPDNVDASQLKTWVEGAALDRIEAVAEHFESEWDGGNWVGKFEDAGEGHTALDELMWWFSIEAQPPTHEGGLMTISDALDAMIIPPEKLTADTSDSQMEALADEILQEAAGINIVILDDAGEIAEHLKEVRADMQEAAAPDSYLIQGYEVIEKSARRCGNSAHVSVPVGWTGHRVRIVRLD